MDLDLSIWFSEVDCLVMVAYLLLLHWSLTWSDISLNITLLGLSAFLTNGLASLICNRLGVILLFRVGLRLLTLFLRSLEVCGKVPALLSQLVFQGT